MCTAGRTIKLEVLSSKTGVYVSINGLKKYEDSKPDEKTRGIHVIVLNEVSGVVVARRTFDTYMGGMEEEALIKFLNIVTDGRIVIFTIKVCVIMIKLSFLQLKTTASYCKIFTRRG